MVQGSGCHKNQKRLYLMSKKWSDTKFGFNLQLTNRTFHQGKFEYINQNFEAQFFPGSTRLMFTVTQVEYKLQIWIEDTNKNQTRQCIPINSPQELTGSSVADLKGLEKHRGEQELKMKWHLEKYIKLNSDGDDGCQRSQKLIECSIFTSAQVNFEHKKLPFTRILMKRFFNFSLFHSFQS